MMKKTEQKLLKDLNNFQNFQKEVEKNPEEKEE